MVRENMKQVDKVKDANKTIRGFLEACDEHVIKPDRINAWSRYSGATHDTHALYWGVLRLQIVESMKNWVKGWELIKGKDTEESMGLKPQSAIFYLCEGTDISLTA